MRGRAPVEIAAMTVRGELVAMQGSGKRASAVTLRDGMTIDRVMELRADRRGAIVALGTAAAAPMMWLRAGTRVRLGTDPRGAVHVQVVEGTARIRRGASATTYVDTQSGGAMVTTDVLVGANPRDRNDLHPSAARPEAADWSLALETPDTDKVAGFGRLEARGAGDRMETLQLKSVNVDVRTAGDVAITEVTHIFHNASADRREGTFRFPVPDGAALTGLALEIDGKLVEGEIVEREKAREVYEKVVDSMLDPALLEWEEGNWFKLRVFPLDANADKRVVIRYVTPLVRSAAGAWEYDYAIAAPGDEQIGDLSIAVNGKVALQQRGVAKGVDLVVPVDAAKIPVAMTESRPDGVYTAVRIAPVLATSSAAAAAGIAPPPKQLAVIIDTSRSALEGKAQQLDVLAATLAELAPADKFVVLASDVVVAPSSAEYVAATPENIAAALAFVTAIEPDGASDLQAALRAAGERHPTDVIYIGDGIATWGDTDPAALQAAAAKIGAPIEAALIGKGAASRAWADLAGKSGGRAMIVKSRLDERRFALAAAHVDQVARLTDAHIDASGLRADAVIFPATSTTLFAGDELVALVKTPPRAPGPTSLKLVGKLDGRVVEQEIPVIAPAATEKVAQRWAREELLAMVDADAPKDDVVKLSQDFGVLSKYTSLLVLESDEMYKQFQIERKAKADAEKAAAAAPTVTGGDLDTLGSRVASLSPDEIQPGDPEIRIPAPASAKSVVVAFPFGETKLAMWDAGEAAWMVRFLIDNGTPDGVYQVRVTITHADGHVQTLTLPYTVDTKSPNVALAAKRDRGAIVIKARQTDRKRDADRVEVQLPDGTILRLAQTARGRFEGRWESPMVPRGPFVLRVVARDHALNQSTQVLVVP